MYYEEQLEAWMSELKNENLTFENLKEKFHPCKQVSAIIFVASKLKDKESSSILHGEHDEIFIGGDWDSFERLTKEDLRIAAHHDLYISDGGGFEMYASL